MEGCVRLSWNNTWNGERPALLTLIALLWKDIYQTHFFHTGMTAPSPPPWYAQVVIAVRGSMSQTDLVTDLLCWPAR